VKDIISPLHRPKVVDRRGICQWEHTRMRLWEKGLESGKKNRSKKGKTPSDANVGGEGAHQKRQERGKSLCVPRC